MEANFYLEDSAFQELMDHLLPPSQKPWARDLFTRMGKLAATEIDRLAMIANKEKPVLRQYDREGTRIDQIVYHPAYLEMAKLAYEFGMVGLPYASEEKRRGNKVGPLIKFGLGYLFSKAEVGLYCPICLTDGTLRVIEKYGNEKLKKEFIPRLASMNFETLYQGAMFLTEKQAGSDVGNIETRAVYEDHTWKLYGEKWFASNVDAEVIITLAKIDGAASGTRGLSLFLVSKTLENGERNSVRINRLKDKLGVASMATGELTFDGTQAYPIGDLKEGFHYMTEMLNLSRLYNAVASLGIMGRSVFESLRYSKERKAFGSFLNEFPLVRRTLIDMVLEWETSLHLVFHTAHFLEQEDLSGNPKGYMMRRILIPLSKYHTGKMSVRLASEALELLGGKGYIEEFVTSRLLRDAQVLPVWEGTSNILALDVLRSIRKESADLPFFQDLQEKLDGIHVQPLERLKERVNQIRQEAATHLSYLKSQPEDFQQFYARELADQMVRLYQGVLLLKEAERDIQNRGSGRNALLVHLFLNRHFNKENLKSPGTGLRLELDFFEALVYRQTLPVEKVLPFIL
ncbi:MAG: acyl-CoA dehydrogenase family protein [Nitrospirae bacterium]|nr:acyl-CoA dehydrogenase family protein [Nitrospirota bacterium]